MVAIVFVNKLFVHQLHRLLYPLPHQVINAMVNGLNYKMIGDRQGMRSTQNQIFGYITNRTRIRAFPFGSGYPLQVLAELRRVCFDTTLLVRILRYRSDGLRAFRSYP